MKRIVQLSQLHLSRMAIRPLVIALSASLTLAACGGGGSGGDSKKPSNNSSRSSVAVSSLTSQIPASSASSVSQPSSAAEPSSESASQSLSQSSVSSSGEASSLSSVEASSVSTSEASSSQVSSAPVVIIPDVTLPGPIAFAAKSGAADCDVITSDAAVVTLINVPVAVTVLGGTYSINAGAYTASPGTVNAGDTLSVQVPCAAVGGQTATATLNVGDLVASFSGTTDMDAIADAIEFTPVVDAPLNSEQVSNAVTISGINTDIAIAITGGEYAIDGAEFTTAPGTINAGELVKVRAIAPASAGSVAAPATTTAALTLGDATYNFTVTAITDSTAPTAEFMFPPPASMTEAPDIFTRIKFKDDLSEIARVFYTLNGGEPVEVDLTQTETINHADGSLEVRATLPLMEAQDNQLRVFAEDALGNRAEVENYAGIMVRQDSLKGDFPNSNNPIFRAWKVNYVDEGTHGRLIVMNHNVQDVAGLGSGMHAFGVDLSDGNRSHLAKFSVVGSPPMVTEVVDEGLHKFLYILLPNKLIKMETSGIFHTVDGFEEINGIGFINNPSGNNPNEFLIATEDDRPNGAIHCQLTARNIVTNTDRVLLNDAVPEGEHIGCGSILFTRSKNQGEIILGSRSNGVFSKFNEQTGLFSIVSGGVNQIGGGPVADRVVTGMVVDGAEKNVLVTLQRYGDHIAQGLSTILSLNISTGDRSVFSDDSTPNSFNTFLSPGALSVRSSDSYGFFVDRELSAIFSLDMTTGYRVFVSKN